MYKDTHCHIFYKNQRWNNKKLTPNPKCLWDAQINNNRGLWQSSQLCVCSDQKMTWSWETAQLIISSEAQHAHQSQEWKPTSVAPAPGRRSEEISGACGQTAQTSKWDSGSVNIPELRQGVAEEDTVSWPCLCVHVYTLVCASLCMCAHIHMSMHTHRCSNISCENMCCGIGCPTQF